MAGGAVAVDGAAAQGAQVVGGLFMQGAGELVSSGAGRCGAEELTQRSSCKLLARWCRAPARSATVYAPWKTRARRRVSSMLWARVTGRSLLGGVVRGVGVGVVGAFVALETQPRGHHLPLTRMTGQAV